MSDNLEDNTSLVEELTELSEAIGYRLGSELYGVLAPVIRATENLKSAFTDGFSKGWKEAREGHKEETVMDGSLS